MTSTATPAPQAPFVPPEFPEVSDIHRRAMAVVPDEARKVYALVELDRVTTEEFNRFRKALKVRGYRDNLDFEWQFDGQTYPLDDPKTGRSGKLKLGERVWVPLLIAQYGVRQSSIWEYDPESRPGRPEYDFLQGSRIPRLRILDFRTPEAAVDQMQMTAKPITVPCTYCGSEVVPAELGAHIEANHLDEILNKATAKQPATSPEAKKAVKDWAANQDKVKGLTEA